MLMIFLTCTLNGLSDLGILVLASKVGFTGKEYVVYTNQMNIFFKINTRMQVIEA